jgi:hypothetical protein
MWGSRKIIAMLAGDTLEGSVARGCPQGGALSPLLWSLVVDEHIGGLNANGYNTLGYADDIVILICGKFPNTVSELLQEALSTVQQWCDRHSGGVCGLGLSAGGCSITSAVEPGCG